MKLYLDLLFYLSTMFVPLLEGQPANIQEISDWMFLLREENSNLYRIKDEAKFKYNGELLAAYQAIFLDIKNEFIMPRVENKEQIVEFDENVVPLCKTSRRGPNGNYVYESVYEELNKKQNYEIVLHSIPRTETDLSIFSTKHISNQCKIPSTPIVKLKSNKKLEPTPDTCILYEVGYWTTNLNNEPNIESKLKQKAKQPKIDNWKTLYEACNNHAFYATYYTYHRIYYTGLLGRKLNPYLNRMNNVKEIIPDVYDLEYQQATFKYHNNVFSRNKFDIHSNFIVSSRLVPPYDMLFESWQYATNEYLNFAPQWRSVNLNNWLKVEEHVRLMGLRMKSNLHVYTGVVYEKPESPFAEILRTIKKNTVIRLPVYHWKYIADENYEFGIVLVTLNNQSDQPCKDICREYGWPYDDFNSVISKGRTRCCDPSTFFEIIPYEVDKVKLSKKIMHFSGTREEESNLDEGSVYRDIWMGSKYFNI